MSKAGDFVRKLKNTVCSVVIVAGGSSVRMGFDKLFANIGGMPVLARSIAAFERSSCVNEIIVVAKWDSIEAVSEMCHQFLFHKVKKIVCGGNTRQESSLAGLSEISSKAKLVLIHDGARPFVSDKIIQDVVHAAALHRCAAPAIPLNDTVKVARDGIVCKTLNRSELVAVQTPQGFQPDIIKAALTKALQSHASLTDDCSAVEAMSIPVYLTEGDRRNFKITSPIDLETAEVYINKL